MHISDLRLFFFSKLPDEQYRRSQPWGFKSLSDTRLRTC